MYPNNYCWIITAWYNRGKNEGEAIRGRKRMHLLGDLMKGKYVALKRTAEDRKEWQKLIRAGSHAPASQQTTWRCSWSWTTTITSHLTALYAGPRPRTTWVSQYHRKTCTYWLPIFVAIIQYLLLPVISSIYCDPFGCRVWPSFSITSMWPWTYLKLTSEKVLEFFQMLWEISAGLESYTVIMLASVAFPVCIFPLLPGW